MNKFKQTFFIIVAMMISSQVLAAKKALLIGIGDYPHVTKLNGPQLDATNFKQLLIDEMGFEESEIKLLIDKDATREGILNATDSWLSKGTSPGDEVVFYFSGHGDQVPDEGGDESDNKDEAIAAYDVALENNKIVNMITDDEIKEAFDSLSDRAVTIVIDSCHSGTLTRGLFQSQDTSYEKTISFFNESSTSPTKDVVYAHRKEESFIESSPNRVVWTAVSAWQKALVDFETKRGSVFTNYFIQGIRDKRADFNNDDEISRSELLKYIRDESNKFCERNAKFCKTGLTPTLETSKDLYVEDAKDISNSLSENSQIENHVYASNALISDEATDLELNYYPKKREYTIGEKINLEVTSKQSGYLLLLDISQTENIIQLYPWSEQEKLSEGYVEQNQKIEFNSIAQGPAGKGHIVALLSKDKIFPDSVIGEVSKDLIIENPKSYLQDITLALNGVWVDEETTRPVDWSVKKIEYEIVK